VSPTRREEISAESRARILRAATDLLAEQGLRAATVHSVAERAGISHTSVGWHFGSKDGLACAVTEAAFEAVFARFAALAQDDAPRTVTRFLEAHRDITASTPGRVFARVLPEVALSDGRLREIYVGGYRRIRELATAYLEPVVVAAAVDVDARTFASALFASGAGVNLMRGLDPNSSRRSGFAVVGQVFSRMLTAEPSTGSVEEGHGPSRCRAQADQAQREHAEGEARPR
jgi:TetR/AcrR family transcriptional regulator, acrAB operon repressor